MWIQDEDGGEDAAVGEEEEDGEVEVLDRRRAFMSVRPSVGRSLSPTHYPPRAATSSTCTASAPASPAPSPPPQDLVAGAAG